jgi:hypothetical protein
LPSHSFDRVAEFVRLARHGTIDAMRRELGVRGSARPADLFNPFQGTEFEGQYKKRAPETSAPDATERVGSVDG